MNDSGLSFFLSNFFYINNPAFCKTNSLGKTLDTRQKKRREQEQRVSSKKKKRSNKLKHEVIGEQWGRDQPVQTD